MARGKVPPEGLSHTAAQGESVDSLAYQYGHFPQTIWEHPRNKELVEKRGDWRVLNPGDVVFVPPLREKSYDVQTGRKHVFRVKNRPALLRFRPIILGEYAKSIKFMVLKDNVVVKSGVTSADGEIEVPVLPDEQQLMIRVLHPEFIWEYTVNLRVLNPITEVTGVQQRLSALGFYQGEIDGVHGPLTEQAVSEFRMSYGVFEGEGLDDKTRDALHRIFGEFND